MNLQPQLLNFLTKFEECSPEMGESKEEFLQALEQLLLESAPASAEKVMEQPPLVLEEEKVDEDFPELTSLIYSQLFQPQAETPVTADATKAVQEYDDEVVNIPSVNVIPAENQPSAEFIQEPSVEQEPTFEAQPIVSDTIDTAMIKKAPINYLEHDVVEAENPIQEPAPQADVQIAEVFEENNQQKVEIHTNEIVKQTSIQVEREPITDSEATIAIQPEASSVLPKAEANEEPIEPLESKVTEEKFAVETPSIPFVDDTVLPDTPFNKVEQPAFETLPKVEPAQMPEAVEKIVIEQIQSPNEMEPTTTAKLQLNPDRLGKLEVQIHLEEKELSVQLVVEKPESKEWIEQQVVHLQEKLTSHELIVKDIQVQVAADPLQNVFAGTEDNPFFKQKQKQSQQNKLFKKAKSDVPIAETISPKQGISKGISILV